MLVIFGFDRYKAGEKITCEIVKDNYGETIKYNWKVLEEGTYEKLY